MAQLVTVLVAGALLGRNTGPFVRLRVLSMVLASQLGSLMIDVTREVLVLVMFVVLKVPPM